MKLQIMAIYVDTARIKRLSIASFYHTQLTFEYVLVSRTILRGERD